MNTDQLDREMAKVMGWKFIRSFEGIDLNEYIYQDKKDTMINVSIEFHPSTDISQAFMVEDRIKELGLEKDYSYHLFKICKPNFPLHSALKSEIFNVIHATPFQRCQAALKAVENKP